MAMRSLGSSLVAKATPGGAYRDTQENRIAKPNIPGKGEVGSIQRGFLEEPQNIAVPGGTEKIVRNAPGVESAPGLPISPEQQQLLAGAIGMANPQAAPLPGSDNQPLLRSTGPSPAGPSSSPTPQGQVAAPRVAAAPVSRGGRSAQVISSGGELASAKQTGGIPEGDVLGAATNYQAPNYERLSIGNAGYLPVINTLSGRASAADPNQQRLPEGQVRQTNPKTGGPSNTIGFTPTTGQYLAGAAGKVLTNIGSAFKAPQLSPGGLGAKLQTWGGAVGPSVAGQGSITSALRSLARPNTNTVNFLRSAASNVGNKLRSVFSNLFKRR